MDKEPKLISVLHPSRSRPERSLKAWNYMRDAMTSAVEVEHILCTDSDDESEYWKQGVNNAGKTMVDALNTAFAHSKGDIIVTLFDDITYPDGWDSRLIDRYQEGKLYHIGGHPQGLQVVCAGCKAVFNDWQCVYYPGYISMYADNDYQSRGQSENRFIDAGFSVKHDHPTSGTAEWDETYKRQNAQSAYDYGRLVFERRLARGFTF